MAPSCSISVNRVRAAMAGLERKESAGRPDARSPRACPTWVKPRAAKIMVCQVVSSGCAGLTYRAPRPRVAAAITTPTQPMCTREARSSTGAPGILGGVRIVSASAGSSPRPRPINPSVSRLSHSSCSGRRATLMPKRGAASMTSTLPRLPPRENLMKRRILA